MPYDLEDSGYALVNRLIELRDLLQRGDFSKAQIQKRLDRWYSEGATGDRQLKRDIRALRALGYQVAYSRETKLYRLIAPVRLNLTNAHVETLAMIRESFEVNAPKSSDVQLALSQIVAALPESQRELFYRKPPLALNLRPAADYRPHAPKIRILERLITERRLVRFSYQPLGQDKPVLHRRIEPYELQFFDRHFYLLGYSPEAQKVLEFRIDRIQDIDPLPSCIAGRKARLTIPFKYRLATKIARLGVSERFLNQRIRFEPNGDAIVEAEGYSDFRILQDLLRYGELAELLGPPDLRAKMREIVAMMYTLYHPAERDK